MAHKGTEAGGNSPLNELALDLEALVDAGLIEFRDEPGARRYALSARGQELAGRKRTRGHDGCESHDWSALDRCPVCGSDAGFDAGARCLRCRIAAPPYM